MSRLLVLAGVASRAFGGDVNSSSVRRLESVPAPCGAFRRLESAPDASDVYGVSPDADVDLPQPPSATCRRGTSPSSPPLRVDSGRPPPGLVAEDGGACLSCALARRARTSHAVRPELPCGATGACGCGSSHGSGHPGGGPSPATHGVGRLPSLASLPESLPGCSGRRVVHASQQPSTVVPERVGTYGVQVVPSETLVERTSGRVLLDGVSTGGQELRDDGIEHRENVFRAGAEFASESMQQLRQAAQQLNQVQDLTVRNCKCM